MRQNMSISRPKISMNPRHARGSRDRNRPQGLFYSNDPTTKPVMEGPPIRVDGTASPFSSPTRTQGKGGSGTGTCSNPSRDQPRKTPSPSHPETKHNTSEGGTQPGEGAEGGFRKNQREMEGGWTGGTTCMDLVHGIDRDGWRNPRNGGKPMHRVGRGTKGNDGHDALGKTGGLPRKVERHP